MLVLVLAAQAATGATAKDRLHQRDRDTSRQIRGARHDYDAASRTYLRALTSLQRARKRLAAAQAALAEARGRVQAAKVARRQADHDLLIANQRLQAVERELLRSRKRIDQVQLAWKREVLADIEGGGTGLQALTTVMNGTSPADVMAGLAGIDAMTAVHNVTLSRTVASIALQRALESQLKSARAEVKARAAAAASEVERLKATLEAAKSARVRVAVLVAGKQQAATRAAAARARDAAHLKELQAEQARIERMLRRRAAVEAKSSPSAPVSPPSHPSSSGGLPWPVSGWISTPFGWRTHPIYGYRSFHNGIDIAASCGTPVRTPAAGQVLQTYFQTAYGNRVLIDHGLVNGVGTATEYNHLERWIVSPGQHVAGGQVIGYVGNTGWSTGCHLHFTVYRSGTPVDPVGILD